MKATEQIRKEHRYILDTLKEIVPQIERMATTTQLDRHQVQSFIRYFNEFVLDRHAANEEAGVFAMLARAGLPTDAGILVVLHREHSELRRMLAQITTLSDPGALAGADGRAVLARALLEFCDHLDSHIDKEETVLLPVAEMTFTEVDQASALRSSRSTERMKAETSVAQRRSRLRARQICR